DEGGVREEKVRRRRCAGHASAARNCDWVPAFTGMTDGGIPATQNSKGTIPNSSRFQPRDRVQRVAQFALGDLEVVALLQVEPDLRAVAAQLAEAQRHRGGDGLLLVQDIVERLARD